MRWIALLLLVGCQSGTHIEKCHPDFGSISGGDDVKVLGSGFATGVTVKLGVKSARVLSVTSDTIEIRTPAADAAGAVDVTVVNSDGTALRLPYGFKYIEEAKGP
jgi:IPT/TIG domain-containing protein